jgi:hypothetical protein
MRFVFSPMHVSPKGQVKPSLFSHVETKGCSIQRDMATLQEDVAFVIQFLNEASNRKWLGVAAAGCSDVRGIEIDSRARQVVCVLDTALKNNPAHAEICHNQYVVEEADRVELRAGLMAAFGGGVYSKPADYRAGQVWQALPVPLQQR